MDPKEPGCSGMRYMTRNQLYFLMQGTTIDKKLEFMETTLLSDYGDDAQSKANVKRKLAAFKHQFRKRWIAAHKTKVVFDKSNKDWLRGTILLPAANNRSSKTSSNQDKQDVSTGLGRPQKPFSESSERTKRRKTQGIRDSNELDELAYAAQMKMRESGKADASAVLKEIQKSPTRAKKYRKAYKKTSQEQQQQLPVDKALAMIANGNFSREQYNIVRETNPKFYPCYSVLQKAKKDLYPPKEAYRVTETCAEIELQPLLDLTAKRLVMHLGNEALSNLSSEEKKTMVLISKWGCDGSQQAQYKMKFENETESDANIFQSSMVPLQLICGKEKKIIWQNDTPSSPRYCRPIRMRFIHENYDITNAEISYITDKINRLEKSKCCDDLEIKHKLVLTMVDGKVCNAATHTSSTMRCYLCGATSSEFNHMEKSRPVKKEYLSFGLSLLHARIRFFESLLHVAYKLPIKKWNKRLNEEEKEIISKRKKEIQDRFKKELGLLVDMPKANYGSTNDGNTSRRFFSEYEKSAEITGLNKELIYRLKTILDALCSGHKINTEKFHVYAKDTELMYINLYGFHPQSPTMHKILRHGAQVIKEAILPIGQLSEEAAEARNKHIREYRLNFSRKFSREACNMDVLNRLIFTSDPVISGMRKVTKNKLKTFNSDVLDLLIPSEATNTGFESSGDDFE